MLYIYDIMKFNPAHERELQKRKSAWKSPGTAPVRGYAKLYMDHVLQAEHGCDFDFLRKA